MKEIGKIQFEKAERELKKQAEELANKVESISAIPEIQEVEANLSDFSLTDTGDYLSISHPALHDATIGVVSKNEYSKGNKEAILRSVLESKFAEYVSTHALKIIGSFVDPTINPAPKEEVVVIPVEKKASEEKPIEPAKEITSDLPLLRSADAFRQSVETVAFRDQEKVNKFIMATSNDFLSHVKSLKYGNPKIVEAIDATYLSFTPTGDINGHLVISASLEDVKGPKYLNVPVPVTANKAVFPNEKEMSKLVAEGFDVMAQLEEKLALEALTEMAKIDAQSAWESENISSILSERTVEITKEASDYTDGIASVHSRCSY